MILIPCALNQFFIKLLCVFYPTHLFLFNLLFVETLKSSCYLRKVAINHLRESFADHQKRFNTSKFLIYKMGAIGTIFLFIYRLNINYQFYFFFSLGWIEKDLGRSNFSVFIVLVVEGALIISYYNLEYCF